MSENVLNNLKKCTFSVKNAPKSIKSSNNAKYELKKIVVT